MAPQNKPVTLHDLESRGGSIGVDAGGLLRCNSPGSNVTWTMNVGLWAVLMVVANIMHPPAILLLVVNAGLLLFNLEAVRRAGTSNVPVWLYVVIACQGLVTLQYGSYAIGAFF